MSTLLLLAHAAGIAAFPQTPTIHYELSSDAAAKCWRVQLRAQGIDPAAGDVRLVLADWGEWTEVDGYLRELSVRPPVHQDPQSSCTFLVDRPFGWDGTIEGSYALALTRFGSSTQQAHGLLPTYEGRSVAAFSANTLFDVHQGEEPLDAVRAIRFVTERDLTIATGWGGLSEGEQVVQFHHPLDNVPLLFGEATGSSAEDWEDLRYEVVQFGAGSDATQQVLDVARTLIPLYGRHCGRVQDEPVRLFLSPLRGGGTHTDHGSVVAEPYDSIDAGLSPEYVRLLAHEMFHDWLGGALKPPDDESLVWFHEGFTEYLAVWHVAASSLAKREWFAERIAAMDAEARDSQAFGQVAFGDLSVRWRDDNGSNETLGYRGGALLAFFADLELRQDGQPGLPRLVADLLEHGERDLTLPAIRDWMETNGLADFYARFVLEPALFPAVDPALEDLGFELYESEASLTYLGIQVEGGETLGRVVAVDPEGPAARADVKIGDRIFGYFPTRTHPPRIAGSVTTPFRCGLDAIASGAEAAELDVLRDGRELKLSVVPRLIPGGVRTGYRAGSEHLAEFFRYDPR